MHKQNISKYIDYAIFACLFLFSITFLFDLKINFLTTAFGLGVIKLLFERPQSIEINSKHLYFIAAFIFCMFLSILFNDAADLSSTNTSVFKSQFISPLVGLLLLVFLFKITKKQILTIISGLALSILLNSIAVIWQYSQGQTGRLTGFSDHFYMFIAVTNTLILPVIFTLAIHKSSIPLKLRAFFLLTSIVSIPAVVFENTRIVWISLAVTFLAATIISIKSKAKAIAVILAVLIAGYGLIQLSPYSANRFKSIADTNYSNQSNSERILIWHSARDMFVEHPVFGIGVGNFHDQYIEKYRSPIAREDLWHPHNVFLAMLSEGGVLGGLSYLALWIYLYYSAIKTYRRQKDIVSIAYLMSLLGYTINSLTDCVFCANGTKTLTYTFWMFTGIYLVLNKYVILHYKNKYLR